MLVQPEIKRLAKGLEIVAETMLPHEFPIEFQPELLDGIGPGSICRQRQQVDLAVDACEIVLDVAMKMDGPVVERHVDLLCLRIVLLHVIKEAIHLFDGEGLSAADDHLTGGDIECSC